MPQWGVDTWGSAPFLWAKARLCPDHRVSLGHELERGRMHTCVHVPVSECALHQAGRAAVEWGPLQRLVSPTQRGPACLSFQVPCAGSRYCLWSRYSTQTGARRSPAPSRPSALPSRSLHPLQGGPGAHMPVGLPSARPGPRLAPRVHSPVLLGPFWWPLSHMSCCILSLETFKYWLQLQA